VAVTDWLPPIQFVLVFAVMGAAGGALTGTLQWLLLYNRIERGVLWVVGSTAGGALGAAIVIGVGLFVFVGLGSGPAVGPAWIVAWGLGGCLGGLLAGNLQRKTWHTPALGTAWPRWSAFAGLVAGLGASLVPLGTLAGLFGGMGFGAITCFGLWRLRLAG